MADDCEDDKESHDKDDRDLDEKSKLPYRTGDMDVDWMLSPEIGFCITLK